MRSVEERPGSLIDLGKGKVVAVPDALNGGLEQLEGLIEMVLGKLKMSREAATLGSVRCHSAPAYDL